ncbi:MAG TPA: Holliday junction resolvase RuvX [Gemmatimonadales bacterium]|nr:Holliday junction resolvase RuvX [Gemmatimonadales bacterium]
MTIPTTGRILGIDWGEVRIGLAVSDESQTLASPVETLTRRRGKRFPLRRFIELAADHRAVGLLVGLPLSSEGDEKESASAARELGEMLSERTQLPLELWDERMSSARALAAIHEQGGSVRGRRGDVDALAAAVLLQNFLDFRQNRVKEAAEGVERE